MSATTFTPDPAQANLGSRQQDVWLNTTPTDVILSVAPKIAHYFTRRDLLPQQRNDPQADGSLTVHARVNHILQVLLLVRWWLPHVRIVEPKDWSNALIQSLWEALDLLSPAIEAQSTLPPEGSHPLEMAQHCYN